MICLLVLFKLIAGDSFMVDGVMPAASDHKSRIGGFHWRVRVGESYGKVLLFVPWAMTDDCVTELSKTIDRVRRHSRQELVLEMGFHPFLSSYTDENLLRIKKAFDEEFCKTSVNSVPVE